VANDLDEAPDLADGDDGGAFEPPEDDDPEIDLPEVLDDFGFEGE